MISIRFRLVLLSTVYALLTGCGVDAAAPRTTECPPAADAIAGIGAEEGGPTLAIAAVDDRFEPACIELDEPGNVTIVVRNDGRHPHNLSVDDRRRVAVDAGQVAFLDVAVPPDGLRYVCTIHPGMEGELRLR